MNWKSILIISLLGILIVALGCSNKSSDRWVTTENTMIEMDWDKLMEAYRTADGPTDFEEKANEVYPGSEIIRISVQDKDARNQEVIGFIDANSDGKVQEKERVFSINRTIGDEYNRANYSVNGYGHYSHYHHTGMWDIAGGVIVGSMIANAMRPNYSPRYSRPYVTPQSRVSTLRTHRDTFRKNNPSFKTGRSGGTWGGRSGSSSSTRRSGSSSSGGSSYGIRQRRKTAVRLTA
jgi:uncharacterized membrane protein YgcG